MGRVSLSCGTTQVTNGWIIGVYAREDRRGEGDRKNGEIIAESF